MNAILNKTIVLVLNRNWQAINVRTPQEAFCQMATNVATALDIDRENQIRPVTWDEWITLSIRPQDNAVLTVCGPIRVPTVIVAVNFTQMPKKRPKLRAKRLGDGPGTVRSKAGEDGAVRRTAGRLIGAPHCERFSQESSTSHRAGGLPRR